MDEFKKLIREVPDFPKPGILFYDITTLLKDREGFCRLIDYMTLYTRPNHADVVLGIEARGFIFGPALAYNINAGFVPIRKPGKLPGETESITYDLEYGSDSLEIHTGAVEKGARVIIADDLLATGGTAMAAAELVEKVGGVVVGFAFVVELDFLRGREKLAGYDVFSLIHYDS
jgi:adenine phosphoribosyltransferase